MATAKIPDDFSIICQCGEQFKYPREQYLTTPNIRRICPKCGTVNVFTTDNAHIVEHRFLDAVRSDLVDGPHLIAASGHVHFDLAEAINCVNAKAYRACAIMCRRCLELALRHKGCTGKDLEKLINNAKARALLDDDDVTPAHAIRLIGNKGAHQKAGQKVLFSEDFFKKLESAKLALIATEGILRKVYNIPEPTP